MKFLFRPVSPWHINQGFGDNTVCISNTDQSDVIKCDGHNPPAGYRSIYSEMLGHNGQDLKVYHRQPIFCAANGKVTRVETEPERGLGVAVESTVVDDDGALRRYRHRYWHLHSIDVKNGQRVKIGDLIGLADNTGYSTGTHLHFDLKELDGSGRIKNYDNGYYGAIDPTPHWHDKSAESVQLVRNLFLRGIISFSQLLKWIIRFI